MGHLVATCPHCGAEKMTFNAIGERKWQRTSNTRTVALVCAGCQKGLFVTVTTEHTSELVGKGGALSAILPDLRVVGAYPLAKEVECPPDTPESVAPDVLDARDSLRRAKWNQAGMSFRRALDVATLDLGADRGKPLYARIEALYSGGKIAEALKDWAHIVRDNGNEAVHEPRRFTEDEARDLDVFVEAFLRYAYTLPKMIERRRAEHPDEKQV